MLLSRGGGLGRSSCFLADLGVVEITPRGLCLQGWVSCVLQRKRLVSRVDVAGLLN